MRLLIDANILLDVLQKRLPHFMYSSRVWKACETRKADGFISTLTFANIVYVMRKELDAEKIHDVLQALGQIFTFADFRATDLQAAAGMKWDDFEDAVQAATAERLGVDFIVTRNGKDFEKTSSPCITPAEFCEKFADSEGIG